MRKIENLTEEQKSKISDYIKKWTDIGLSTEPANRIEAEKYINLAYSNAGLNQPEKIVWCGSPLSLVLTREILLDNKVPSYVWASVGASVWDSVWDSVGASVWDSVGDSVLDSVCYSVWNSVGNSVNFSVWNYVVHSLCDYVEVYVGNSMRILVHSSLRASLRASLWDSISDSVSDFSYGQHDAIRLGFYDFFRSECELIDETEKLTALIGIAKNAGWFSPYENICFVSERPNVLNLNEDGKLHCVDGPAIAYPDGWCIYAKNGVIVQECEITNKGN